MDSNEQFIYNIGNLLGLIDGLARKNEVLSLTKPIEFVNFINPADSNISKNLNFSTELIIFNEGISNVYSKLNKSFKKVTTPEKLKIIFEIFSNEIEQYKDFISEKFNNLMYSTVKKINTTFLRIQDIRTQRPYLFGLIICNFMFSNSIKKLISTGKENSLYEKTNEFTKRIPEFLYKLNEISNCNDFSSFFWVGYIEMLLKIHSHFLIYDENLNDYIEKIHKIENKLMILASNLRLKNEIFTLYDVFS